MVSPEKQKLTELQRENRYVFHGSGDKLSELEPRQAYCWSTGTRQPDGAPAVFASDLIEYAIFMSVINRTNCKRTLMSSCKYENETLIFGASKETLDQLSDTSPGYIHVFDRAGFEHRGGCEWRCFHNVKPVEVIQVHWLDFEYPIELLQHPPD